MRSLIPDPANYNTALKVYNGGLTRAFGVSLVVTCFAVVGAVGMEWKVGKGKGR